MPLAGLHTHISSARDLVRAKLLWRFEFLGRRTPFSWRERIEYVTPFGGARSVTDLFMRRVRRAPDGAEYFDINGTKLFFRPDHQVASDADVLRGISLILEEAYVRPPDFFSPHVRIRPGDVVFDLGANVGTSAMLFSPLAGPTGHVFSFEPVFHQVLQRNLEENGIRNVTVVPSGVADRTGEIEFTITDAGIDSRIATGRARGRNEAMPVIALDDFVAARGLERVDFIKMDIEGAEELAIRGAFDLIARCRPRWSIASYHTDPTGEKQHPKLVRLLREQGYRVDEAGQSHIYAY